VVEVVVVVEVAVEVGVVEVVIFEALLEVVAVQEVFVGEVPSVEYPEVLRMVLVPFDGIEVAFVLKSPPINDRLLASKRAGD